MHWSFFGWEEMLAAERAKPYFPALFDAVEAAYASQRRVFPPSSSFSRPCG